MSFYDRLIAETQKERIAFTTIPLIREAVRSGASRELYLDFLIQAYHHVKHTFPLLAFAASRTKDEAYQDALVEYMEEERGHEKWILNDIAAMSGDAAAVRDGAPGIACQVMVGYTYYAIEWVSPYAMLGSVHVLEGMSTLLADKAADAIQRSLRRRQRGLLLSPLARRARCRACRLLQAAREQPRLPESAADRDRRVQSLLPALRRRLSRACDASPRQKSCSLRASARSSPEQDQGSAGRSPSRLRASA